MSIASKIFLAAAFATDLLAPGGAQAAVQGFSIALTDMTFQVGSNLSAEVAACCGQNGMPAMELQHNGTYHETLTGDYAVTDTLPPSDESEFWHTFTQISLNGQPFFTADVIAGPYSPDDIWQAVLGITKLTSAQLMVLRAVLEHFNAFSVNMGELDYRYNFAPDDRTTGTFAVGTTGALGLLPDVAPVSNGGPDVWSLTFSATVTTIPEPPTWLMLMAGGAGLLVIRGLARRPGIGRLRAQTRFGAE